MKYVIYIDVLFMINFIADFILLYGLRIILKLKTNIIRLLLGAFVGAVWAVLSLQLRWISAVQKIIISCLIINVLMIITAYGTMNLRKLMKSAVILYVLTFIMAGIIYAIRTYVGISPWIFLICMFCSMHFITALWNYVEDTRMKNKYICRVEVSYKGTQKKLTALLDTGNHLLEPESRRPVHIMSAKTALKFCRTITGVTFIPYRSIGKTHGMLPGIYMDYLDIEYNEKKIRIDKPLIGVSREQLSENNEYEILLNAACESYF